MPPATPAGSSSRYEMNKERPNIVYLGFSGFPHGLAELQRLLLISKSLCAEGASVKVIGRRGVLDRKRYPGLKKTGHYQGIIYVNSSGSPYREPSFIKRNLGKLTEGIREFMVLRRIKRESGIDAAIVSSMDFRLLFFYRLVSRLIGFKLLLNFVELNSSISGRGSMKFRLNDFLFDKYSVKLSDGVLVISEYLIRIIKKTAKAKPYLKIPVLVDLSRYNADYEKDENRYFLFCGAADYKEIIFFNIRSFELARTDDLFLYIVTNGSDERLKEIHDHAALSAKSDHIRIFSKVSDAKLSALYKNASALLIPLRPTLQDEARFPHKFGEYTASGNPVITTNYGEVRYYFRDMDNALVSEVYDEKEFAMKMEYIITNPEESRQIGVRGSEFATAHADYSLYGERIIGFLETLGRKNNERQSD